MGFNSGFKGLNSASVGVSVRCLVLVKMYRNTRSPKKLFVK